MEDKQELVTPSKLLIFTAHCSGYPLRVLLDSGAQSNFISAAIVKKASLSRRRLMTPMYIRHSNGVESEVAAEVPSIKLVFRESSFCVSGIEVPDLNYDIILGQPWHQQVNPQIDWRTQQVVVNGVTLESLPTTTSPGCQTKPRPVQKSETICANVDCNCAPHLKELVQEFADVFANDLPERRAIV